MQRSVRTASVGFTLPSFGYKVIRVPSSLYVCTFFTLWIGVFDRTGDSTRSADLGCVAQTNFTYSIICTVVIINYRYLFLVRPGEPHISN
jgi:hypothetical protein